MPTEIENTTVSNIVEDANLSAKEVKKSIEETVVQNDTAVDNNTVDDKTAKSNEATITTDATKITEAPAAMMSTTAEVRSSFQSWRRCGSSSTTGTGSLPRRSLTDSAEPPSPTRSWRSTWRGWGRSTNVYKMLASPSACKAALE